MEKCSNSTQVDTVLRGIAGVFLLISIGLTEYHAPEWKWFSVFIALNLLQSSFTGWCPMMTILRRVCGLKG